VLSIAAILMTGQVSALASTSGASSSNSGQELVISGNPDGLIYPGGPAQPLAVKLTNTTARPITLTRLTVTLASSTLPRGCPTTDFHITPSNISGAQSTTVPAFSSVTLPDSVNAPEVIAQTIRMSDSRTDQRACEGTTFSLLYTSS